jgi:ABC-type multidrug transport system fused ATPase/permease subunit
MHSPRNQLFSREDWTSRSGMLSFFWGALAALAVIPLAFSFLFLLELIETRGQIRLRADEARQVFEDYQLSGSDQLPEAGLVRLSDYGLLPVVYHSRDRISGRVADFLFRNLSPLRKESAILFLVVTLALSLLVIFLAIERNRIAVYRMVQAVEARTRRMLHRQILRLGQSDLSGDLHKQAAGLFHQQTVRLGETLVDRCQRISGEIPLAVGLILAGVLVDWLTFLLCLLPLGAGWFIWLIYSNRTSQRRDELERIAMDDLDQLAAGLESARLVRGYSMDEFEQSQFQRLIDDYHQRRSEMAETNLWTSRFGVLIGLILLLIVLTVLISELLQSTELFALPRAVTLMTLIVGVMLVLRDLPSIPALRSEANRIGDRIADFLAERPQVGQAVGAKFLSPVSRSVYCESVTYIEPGHTEPLLKNLDLKIKAGDVVAVVSLDRRVTRALALLMPRLIEPHSGRILFDGEDIAWGTLESIRAETLFVTPDDPVLTGTVLENLTGTSPDYSLQKATDAAKLAHAHNFIIKLPNGYETPLGVRGVQLDVGQRYRLALARAVLRNPAFLILEEPRTPLDEDVKDLLDDAYSRIFPDRTVLLIPGRLSTIKKADRVIVLHNGRVETVGTHDALVKNNALYRHWEYVKFNQFRTSEDS